MDFTFGINADTGVAAEDLSMSEEVPTKMFYIRQPAEDFERFASNSGTTVRASKSCSISGCVSTGN